MSYILGRRPKEVQLKYGGSGGRSPPEKFLKISEQNSFRNKYFFFFEDVFQAEKEEIAEPRNEAKTETRTQKLSEQKKEF